MFAKIFSILLPYSIDSSYLKINSGVLRISIFDDKRPRKYLAVLSFNSFSKFLWSSCSRLVKYTLQKDKSLVTSQAVIVIAFKIESRLSSKIISHRAF